MASSKSKKKPAPKSMAPSKSMKKPAPKSPKSKLGAATSAGASSSLVHKRKEARRNTPSAPPITASAPRNTPSAPPITASASRNTALAHPITESSTQTISSLPWPFRDDIQKDRYLVLAKRPLEATRYIDFGALETLGLKDEIDNMIRAIGWTKFVNVKCPGYVELTLEFLSSFHAELHPCEESDDGVITFRLEGIERIMSMREFNSVFGFDCDGLKRIPGVCQRYDYMPEWKQLISEFGFQPGITKAKTIYSPALRYMHRFIAHSLLGRGGSTNTISRQDSFLLWAMHKGVAVNTGYWFCNHLKAVASSNDGPIVIGGLVTAIAQHFGIAPSPSLTVIHGSTRVGLDTCVKIKLCGFFQNHYLLLDHLGKPILQDPQASHATAPPLLVEPLRTANVPLASERYISLDRTHAEVVALRAELTEFKATVSARLDDLLVSLAVLHNRFDGVLPHAGHPPPSITTTTHATKADK